MTEQENLELQIQTYDANYRAGTPLCTDEVYDKLVEELKQKFPKSKLLKKGVIEQVQKESRKEQLPLPMYSLNKCKSLDEIKQWLKSNNINDDEILIITAKYDGISLVTIESEDKAWTRGDGEVGQRSDVHFCKLNDKHCGTDIIAFGEAIMPKKNFIKYKDKFANPRNMVAGLFNRDEAGDELRDVDYVRYGCNYENLDKIDQLDILNRINEINCSYLKISVEDFLKGKLYCQEMGTESLLNYLYETWSINYQIDGLVVDINSAKIRNELGREENMNPKYARAIKLPEWSQSAEVKVLGVTWEVSKQGKLKPVINIESTELAGVVISNVTGYNAKYIFDNNIAEDSIIKIVRSGDVIPKHIKTLSYNVYNLQELSDEISICPSCGEPTKWDETMTELICINPDCKEKKIAKLVHFFSTLEIEDFGEPSIRKIYESGYETIDQILRMTIEGLSKIERWGDKSSLKLWLQFDKLKEVGVPFAKLLHALDLTEGKIGEKTIQLIIDNIPEFLMSDFRDITVSSLLHINGVAEITARAFLDGVLKFFEYYKNLPIKISYVQTPKREVVGNKYEGMKICFTGCRPTKEQEKEIQSQGGEIVSGISSKTTHLVVKDINSTSSKMEKAKNAGITIITFDKI